MVHLQQTYKLILSFFNLQKYPLVFLSAVIALLITGCSDKRLVTLATTANDTTAFPPKTFGFGRTATAAEIAAIDIDIMPDGHGLPAGSGNVLTGKNVYEIKCAFCHGKNGTEGPFSVLVGGDTTKAKTIGNYWPYSTTLFDYIRRAMPYNMPGSLKDSEVYSLTAFLLYKNKIIDTAAVMDAASLPKVKMPAQKLFINDDRRGGPEVR